VRWGWLAFLAALVALTLLFFAAMILVTKSEAHHGRDWKSSPLPLMFHGLDENTLREHETDEHIQVKDMERTAGDVHVRLSPSEKGWKFRKLD
jgi:hypothetical protein